MGICHVTDKIISVGYFRVVWNLHQSSKWLPKQAKELLDASDLYNWICLLNLRQQKQS